MKIDIENKEFELLEKDGEVFINGKKVDSKVIQNDEELTVNIDGENFRIRIEEKDGQFKIRSNGKSTIISVTSKADEILSKIGISDWSKTEESDLKAPMPGKILDVLISVGEQVEKGQSLVVLEAMKMENMLKSPKDGIIAEIKTLKADTVEKNQILITFES